MDITLEHPLSLKHGDSYGKDGPAMTVNSSEYDFPSIRIDGPQALDFPEDALVTFRVKRGEVVARSASRGRPASASVELQLIEVCDVDECEPEEEAVEADDSNSIDKLFEQTIAEKSEEDDE